MQRKEGKMKFFLFDVAKHRGVETLFYIAEKCWADSVLYIVDQDVMVIDGYDDVVDLMRYELESPGLDELSVFFRNCITSNLLKAEELAEPQIFPEKLYSKTLKNDFVRVKLKPHYLRHSGIFSEILGCALDYDAKSILYTEGKLVGLTIIFPKKVGDDLLWSIVDRGWVPEPPICLADSSKD